MAKLIGSKVVRIKKIDKGWDEPMVAIEFDTGIIIYAGQFDNRAVDMRE
jgi:hypothetical protein